ncbi:MAG: hypothetical protein ACI3ZN_05530 [Candidatus Cryptobacteroides sp.]
MRFGMSSLLAVWLSFLMVLPGCSVKENRSGCPCVLILDLSGLDADRFPSVVLSAVSDDGILFNKSFNESEYEDCLQLTVPRMARAVSVTGFESENVSPQDISGREDGFGLLIPYGSDCPSVHLFAEKVDVSGETDTVKVNLHKNYCKMRIALTSESQTDFGVEIKGNYCGYGICGELIAGPFANVPEIGPDGKRTVCLPRQGDSSLVMALEDELGTVRNFAIGEYIASTGYDWTEEDLRDIDVTIDFIRTELVISVEDWSENIIIDKVL